MRSKTTLCVGATILALTGCSSPDDEQATVEETPTPEAVCSTDSPLEVVEQGWSTLPGDDNLVQVTFGAVVENISASSTVGYGGTIEVTFLDDSGRELGYGDGSEPETAQIFDFKQMHPGAVAAVSGMALMSEPPAEVAFNATGACVQDPATVPEGAVAVTDSDLSMDGDELSISMTIESTYDDTKDGSVAMIFRDSGGQIVGGGPYQGMSGNAPSVGPIPPGESSAEVSVDVTGFLPDDADLDATDVHIVHV